MGKLSKLLESIENDKENTNVAKVLPLTEHEEEKPLKDQSDAQVLRLSNVDPKILTYHDPENIVAEHFKILRSQILHPRTGLPSRFILVTSAVPKEGKTYVSINLAFSFARSAPTILIEADLRKPTFKEKLGIAPEYGLSDYLSGRVSSLEDVIYKTDYPNLFIIPAGNITSEVKDLFSSEAVVALMEALRNRFPKHFFIFDSPPVLVASETISLARLADGILFVVRYAFSDAEVVNEAVDKIGKSKLLGFVFNNYRPSFLGLFSPKLKYYRYAYKYRYYKSR
ncbi:P-loop NTPase family protein [Thermodesulfatator atlanticus]|uniref:hypothetical protein n=1 Tax=Thermodesulfatator atlanticus TaxID=501497 RepID=UPI0003B773B4|nr:hypothetical protein [Thermodesulfatator atlanticus]